MFDLTARRTAKRDALGFFGWALPRLDPALGFVGWLDARTAPPPPVSELTCDALAEFLDPARPDEPWMLVAEFQTEPRHDDLERVLEYMLRFRRERRPLSDPRLKYLVGGLTLNLTGPRQADALGMPLPGMPEYGLGGRVVRLAVREEDAAGTLARIAAGELRRCVLPWVALMNGSGSPAVIEEWKRLADLEPNPQVRLEYAGDALVFAELPGVRNEWKQALEGWNVLVSQQVMEWQAIGAFKQQKALLLRALEKRCKAPVPNDLKTSIQATEDLSLLENWFDAAIEVSNFDDFRAAMQSRP